MRDTHKTKEQPITKLEASQAQRKQAEDKSRRNFILEAISFAAEEFLKAIPGEDSIRQALPRLGQATGVSRVYIFENHIDEHGTILVSQRYEWVAPGIVPQIDNPELQAFPWRAGGFARWEEVMRRGEIIHGHVREFPAGERAVLEPQNIKSIVAVPIFIGQEWWGFIGFDECLAERRWSTVEMDALRVAANILGAATQHKQAEEVLRQSEEFNSSLLTNSPIPIHVINPDTSIRYVNPALERLTGFPSAEVIGLRAPYPWWPEETLRETFKDFREAMHKGAERVEELFQKKNGGLFWVEVTFMPVMLDDDLTYYLSSWVDITKRKQINEALEESEKKYRTLFQESKDAIFITTQDGKLIDANQAFLKLFGYTTEEALGMDVRKTYVNPDNRLRFQQEIERGGAIRDYELKLQKKDGTELDCLLTATVRQGKDGDVLGYHGFIRDITERKKMQEQLIITDRLASIGELASGLAHELNNPLTSVIGFSQLLLDKDVSDDIREDIETIYKEAQRTADVVKNLLTFARKHALVKQPVALNSIIDKVLELRAYEQRVNNIQVNTHLAPDMPEVVADYFQFQQVFLNIVINAEHFMIEAHNRGTLTITTERKNGIVKATFTDDGPGISKEDLGHLFDPFFTTKDVGKGTGLGLSICHGIVTEHGGRIYAQSEPGKGATFIIELPITDTTDEVGEVK